MPRSAVREGSGPRVRRRSTLLGAVLLGALLPGCKSSAPYTLPAAGINAALAAGASVAQRSAGGCFAQCVGGTICNPNTGFCESPGAVCLGIDSDPISCLNRPGTTMDMGAAGPGTSPFDSPIGISPMTGTVPPPTGAVPPPPPMPGR
jgi:hypothetical protein